MSIPPTAAGRSAFITHDLATVAARVDGAARAAWPGATIRDIGPLSGGRSKLTYAGVLDVQGRRRPVVIKVAPAGLAPVGNRDVLRQSRMLRLLAGRPDVAVPELLLEDAGGSAERPPFYVMGRVEGESVEPHIDQVDALPAPADLDQRARAAARMLAALHRIEPDSVGLATEEAVGNVAETRHWQRALATVSSDLVSGHESIGRRLLETAPAESRLAIVHGDYRLGNLVSRAGAVRAILDWEIWGKRDTRVDLSWMVLASDPDVHPSAVRVAPGMPAPQELVAEYEALAGPQRNLEWFIALSLYKLGAEVSLLVKYALRRGDADIAQEQADRLPGIFARAREVLR